MDTIVKDYLQTNVYFPRCMTLTHRILKLLNLLRYLKLITDKVAKIRNLEKKFPQLLINKIDYILFYFLTRPHLFLASKHRELCC